MGLLLPGSLHRPTRPRVGELRGPPAHCSYARDFLLEAGGSPRTCAARREWSTTIFPARVSGVSLEGHPVDPSQPLSQPGAIGPASLGAGPGPRTGCADEPAGSTGGRCRQLAGYVPGRLHGSPATFAAGARVWSLSTVERCRWSRWGPGGLGPRTGGDRSGGGPRAHRWANAGGDGPGGWSGSPVTSHRAGRRDDAGRLEPLHGRSVVSIPRDLYRDIPLHGREFQRRVLHGGFHARAGSAALPQGPSCSRRTVQRALGVSMTIT